MIIGFTHNVGKTLVVLLNKVLKLVGKTFAVY